jgi:transposase
MFSGYSFKSVVYNTYTNKERNFVDKIIETPEEKGNIAKFAKEFLINPRTAERWWKTYQKTGEIPYKKSKNNSGPKSTFTKEHKDFIKNLLNDDPQLVADDIIEELTKQFQDFSISNAATQSSFEEHYADYY